MSLTGRRGSALLAIAATTAAAGPGARPRDQSFGGLAPGASETRALTGLACTATHVAMVDDLEEVEEADEADNTKGSETVFC